MNNVKKIAEIIGIKGLIPIVIFIIILCINFAVKKDDGINLSKYIIVTIDGLDGHASSKAVLDDVGIYNALAGSDATDADKAQYTDFVNSIKYTLDNQSDLSNGDTVKVNVTYDETLADKLDLDIGSTTKIVDVSGLEDGQELDVFANIQVIISGVSPFVYVSYQNNATDEYLASLKYEFNKSTNLSAGDTITIKCLVDQAKAAEKGYYVTKTQMDYTIQDVSTYVKTENQLDKKVLNTIAAEDLKCIYSQTKDTTFRMLYKLTEDRNYLYQDNNESVDTMELYKVILASKKGNAQTENENYIFFIYQGKVANWTYSEDAFFCFSYTNAVVLADGKFQVASDSPEQRYTCATSYDRLYSKTIKELESNFDLIEINGISAK